MVGCFFTFTLITKSPPKFPFPLNFKLESSAIPLGIIISSLELVVSTPDAEQAVQGDDILVPSPKHELHYALKTIIPCFKVI